MKKLSQCISEEKFTVGVLAVTTALAPLVQELCAPGKDLTVDQKFACEAMVAAALSNFLGQILARHFKPGDLDGYAEALKPVLGTISDVISDVHKLKLPTPEFVRDAAGSTGTLH